mmetsp:Transcript_32557/g.82022  ORF Transcript_32557/g.82022 Transcript_32557/m.82022 type:complete len:450 (-) Transcript_32557:344-1693(-)
MAGRPDQSESESSSPPKPANPPAALRAASSFFCAASRSAALPLSLGAGSAGLAAARCFASFSTAASSSKPANTASFFFPCARPPAPPSRASLSRRSRRSFSRASLCPSVSASRRRDADTLAPAAPLPPAPAPLPAPVGASTTAIVSPTAIASPSAAEATPPGDFAGVVGTDGVATVVEAVEALEGAGDGGAEVLATEDGALTERPVPVGGDGRVRSSGVAAVPPTASALTGVDVDAAEEGCDGSEDDAGAKAATGDEGVAGADDDDAAAVPVSLLVGDGAADPAADPASAAVADELLSGIVSEAGGAVDVSSPPPPPPTPPSSSPSFAACTGVGAADGSPFAAAPPSPPLAPATAALPPALPPPGDTMGGRASPCWGMDAAGGAHATSSFSTACPPRRMPKRPSPYAIPPTPAFCRFSRACLSLCASECENPARDSMMGSRASSPLDQY